MKFDYLTDEMVVSIESSLSILSRLSLEHNEWVIRLEKLKKLSDKFSIIMPFYIQARALLWQSVLKYMDKLNEEIYQIFKLNDLETIKLHFKNLHSLSKKFQISLQPLMEHIEKKNIVQISFNSLFLKKSHQLLESFPIEFESLLITDLEFNEIRKLFFIIQNTRNIKTFHTYIELNELTNIEQSLLNKIHHLFKQIESKVSKCTPLELMTQSVIYLSVMDKARTISKEILLFTEKKYQRILNLMSASKTKFKNNLHEMLEKSAYQKSLQPFDIIKKSLYFFKDNSEFYLFIASYAKDIYQDAWQSFSSYFLPPNIEKIVLINQEFEKLKNLAPIFLPLRTIIEKAEKELAQIISQQCHKIEQTLPFVLDNIFLKNSTAYLIALKKLTKFQKKALILLEKISSFVEDEIKILCLNIKSLQAKNSSPYILFDYFHKASFFEQEELKNRLLNFCFFHVLYLSKQIEDCFLREDFSYFFTLLKSINNWENLDKNLNAPLYKKLYQENSLLYEKRLDQVQEKLNQALQNKKYYLCLFYLNRLPKNNPFFKKLKHEFLTHLKKELAELKQKILLSDYSLTKTQLIKFHITFEQLNTIRISEFAEEILLLTDCYHLFLILLEENFNFQKLEWENALSRNDFYLLHKIERILILIDTIINKKSILKEIQILRDRILLHLNQLIEYYEKSPIFDYIYRSPKILKRQLIKVFNYDVLYQKTWITIENLIIEKIKNVLLSFEKKDIYRLSVLANYLPSPIRYSITHFIIKQQIEIDIVFYKEKQKAIKPVFGRLNDNEYHFLAACEQENLELMIEYVQEKNVDINIQNEKGQSALHIACEHKWTKGCQWLIAHGADITMKDKQGFNFLSMTVNSFDENRNFKIVTEKLRTQLIQSNIIAEQRKLELIKQILEAKKIIIFLLAIAVALGNRHGYLSLSCLSFLLLAISYSSAHYVDSITNLFEKKIIFFKKNTENYLSEQSPTIHRGT